MNKLTKEQGSAHIIVIIALVILLLGALGYIFWQNFVASKDTPATTNMTSTKTDASTDAYEGWQTYKDTDAGFSMRYPADWKLDTKSGASDNETRFVSPQIKEEQGGSVDAVGYDVAVTAQPKTNVSFMNTRTVVLAMKETEAGKSGADYGLVKHYSETINSIKAFEADMQAQSPYFAAIFPIKDSYVEISFEYAATKADLTDTLTKILKSVKAL